MSEREAAARGTSVATLVREAIDRSFPPGHDRRAAAAAAILDAEPMEVPDVEFRASSRHTIVTIVAAAVSIWLTFYIAQVV